MTVNKQTNQSQARIKEEKWIMDQIPINARQATAILSSKLRIR